MKKELLHKLASLRCIVWENNGRQVNGDDFSFFVRLYSRSTVAEIKEAIANFEVLA